MGDVSKDNIISPLKSHFNGIEKLFKKINEDYEELRIQKSNKVNIFLQKITEKDVLIEQLKTEVSLLKNKLKNREERVSQVEDIVRTNQKKFLTKSSEWNKIFNTYQKYCNCKVGKKFKKDFQHNSNNSTKTHASVESNDIAKEEHFEKTDSFSVGLSEKKISTPIVGESEFLFTFKDPIDDGNENSEWISSPSICGTATKFLRPDTTSNNVQNIDTAVRNDPLFDAITIDTPKRRPASFETSGDLFGDISPLIIHNLDGQKKDYKNSEVVNSSWIDKSNQVNKQQSKNKISIQKNNDKNKKEKKSSKKKYDMGDDSFFNDDITNNSFTNNVPSSTKIELKDETKMETLENTAANSVKKSEFDFQIPKPILPVHQSTCLDSSAVQGKEFCDDSLDELDGSAFFDKLLNKQSRGKPFKCTEVVRGKRAREKLNGFDCRECRKYYESDNLSESQLSEILKRCSRHRHESAPAPDTPPEFWSVGFPATQEYIKKGYLLNDDESLPNHMKPIWSKESKKRVKYQ